jgi:hypothetical protein
MDFAAIYYGSRCVIDHQDPYRPDVFLKTYQAEGGRFPTDKIGSWTGAIVVTVGVNLPTTLFLVAPLALLPYATAQALWVSSMVVLLVIACYLIWNLSDSSGPVLSGFLIGIILANCSQMIMLGNAAGIAVSLCLVATCCLMKSRYTALAVILFALSLAIKPHDAGFVWLYLLLAGGVMRRRALQILAVTCAIGIAASIWIAPVSPHWMDELHRNHVFVSQLGMTSDPSPSGVTSGNPGAILDLQAALSVLLPDPHSYNLAAYLIVGPLLGVWAWLVIRKRNTTEGMWLALAVIAVLSLLPVYHRAYDAKLLLLTAPAFAKLWAEGGARRWLSLGFTAGGVILTSDFFMAVLVCLSRKPAFAPSLPGDKAITLFLLPPLALLAMGCFYLWIFIYDTRAESVGAKSTSARELVAVSSAT